MNFSNFYTNNFLPFSVYYIFLLLLLDKDPFCKIMASFCISYLINFFSVRHSMLAKFEPDVKMRMSLNNQLSIVLICYSVQVVSVESLYRNHRMQYVEDKENTKIREFCFASFLVFHTPSVTKLKLRLKYLLN